MIDNGTLHVTGSGPSRETALEDAMRVAQQFYGAMEFSVARIGEATVDDRTTTTDAAGRTLTTYARFEVPVEFTSA